MGGDEPTLEAVTGTIRICSACLDGAGGECHTPGCILWINRAPDLAIREMLLANGCRIRAEATAEEPAPVLCHPTDPCAHGITGPCSKCQQPPLRPRTEDESTWIVIGNFEYRLTDLRKTLARHGLVIVPDAPPATLTEQERAVLEACSKLRIVQLKLHEGKDAPTKPAITSTGLSELAVAELARRAAERKGEKT